MQFSLLSFCFTKSYQECAVKYIKRLSLKHENDDEGKRYSSFYFFKANASGLCKFLFLFSPHFYFVKGHESFSFSFPI